MELLSISCLIFQLVETEDLDRNWRATRRERLKEQEKKIYEEFVQEKDVVYSVLEGTSLLFFFFAHLHAKFAHLYPKFTNLYPR